MSARRAFTLLETLVAIALFGMAAAVLVMSVTTLMQAFSLAGDSSEADFIREFALRAAEGKRTAGEVEQGGELMTPDGEVLRWKGEVFPEDSMDLYRLTLTVSGDRHSGGAWVVKTLVYKPDWGAPVSRAARIAALKDSLQRGEGGR